MRKHDRSRSSASRSLPRARRKGPSGFHPELLALESRALLTTFSVTSTGDAGAGTLRQAIIDANANGGPDIINFSIGSGLQTIGLQTLLPSITESVVVDGWSQPGFTGTPLIEVTDAGAGSGFILDGSNITLRGLVINGFSSATSTGVWVRNGGSDKIQGCYIGTDATGSVGVPNDRGISIDGGTGLNIVGTDGDGSNDAIEGNLISGNATGNFGFGVHITGQSLNTIAGNTIGLNAAGTAALPNNYGVRVNSGSQNNVIGTNSDGTSDVIERNFISGNAAYGVAIEGASTNFNRVKGNFIGTNLAGNAAVANIRGILIGTGASSNTIGTNSDGLNDGVEGNLISGNTNEGVLVLSANSNVMAGNTIGLNLAGTAALANGEGIILNGSTTNTIGGITTTARNYISGNTQRGINITSGANHNWVLGNFIGTDFTGNAKIPNSTGIGLGSPSNLIGTNGDGVNDAAERNIISGNIDYELAITGTNNKVSGNYLGVNAAGNAALGEAAGLATFFATGNTIGTDSSNDAFDVNERNTISGGVILGNVNTVAGNYIGLNASGTAALISTIQRGVQVGGNPGTRVGTDGDGIADAVERNVIGGFPESGIAINQVGGIVAGNYIGTNAAGTVAIPNRIGILFTTSGTGIRIGTNGDGVNDAIEGNLISGSTTFGIRITDGSNANQIAGNTIGLNAAGTAALGNAQGIMIDLGATRNTIGGTAPTAGNTISGNAAQGVLFSGNTTTQNVLTGNFIGTSSSRTSPVPNAVGVEFLAGTSGNSVGGLTAAESNVIAFNTGPGIAMATTDVTNNSVRQNRIVSNGGLGIDLGPVGVTSNDPGDLDGYSNAPVITSASIRGHILDVSGFARAGKTIEFYVAGPDASGFGEGTTFLGRFVEGSPDDSDAATGSYASPLRGLNVGSDSTNQFRFVFSVPDGVVEGSVITAVTIDRLSEFSANIKADAGQVFGAPVVDATGDVILTEGDTFSTLGSFTDLDSDTWTATVDYGEGAGFQPLVLNPVTLQNAGDNYTLTASGTFNLAHVYRSAGTFYVTVAVKDDSGKTGYDTLRVQILNSPPTVDNNDIHLSPVNASGATVISENGVVTVTGRFKDPSPADTHTVNIVWGDGTTSPATINPLNKTFTASHTYLDDGPTNTEADAYTLQVIIQDNTGGTGQTTYGLFYVQTNNVLPTNFVVSTSRSTLAEGDVVSLNGTFTDPGTQDTHQARIDWGDGSPIQQVNLNAGDLSFSGITHVYANNPTASAGSYAIRVELTDDDEPLRPAVATASLTVADAPASGLTFHAVPGSPLEGIPFTLTGAFVDPGSKDQHRLVINWGDGRPNTTITLAAGVTTFSAVSHIYVDDSLAQPGGKYTITIQVTDPAEPTGPTLTGTTLVTGLNATPVLGPIDVRRADGSPLSLTALPGALGQVVEGDEVVLTGAFTDDGSIDTHTVLVTWGDGSSSLASVDRTTRTYSARHRYLDNVGGTPLAAESIQVKITDNGGASSTTSAFIGVQNATPTSRIRSNGGSLTSVTLSAEASDAGPIDAASLVYSWSVPALGLTGNASTFTLTGFTAFQAYQVNFSVTDKDGASSTSSFQVIVLDDNDNIFQIPAAPAGISGVVVFGLGGNDTIAAGTLTIQSGQVVRDAQGVPLVANPLTVPVTLDGGSGNDVLIGGGAGDTIYLRNGNDTAYGLAGADTYLLKPNSTLSVVDGSAGNTLDFGLADFGSNVGITFDLRLTGGQTQDIAPVGSLANLHFVTIDGLGTGTFPTLNGSTFDDDLTAASGSTLFAGDGNDTLRLISSLANPVGDVSLAGGGGIDSLLLSGPNIGNLIFNGDDGADTINNSGTILGTVVIGGGADADTVINGGTILGTITINGGADGDLVTNLAGGTIGGTITINGDDGADIVNNQGVITGPIVVSGGADGDTVVNSGTISGGLTLSGGADADVVTNLAGGTLGGTITINGDDGADIVNNQGVISGPIVINGGADGDTVVNSGTLSGTVTIGGGADGDAVVNSGTIQGVVVISGGADGDTVSNLVGGTISGPITVNGDDGADIVSNAGTITGALTINGGADGDTVVNSGTISGGLVVSGGADGDLVVNQAGGTLGGTITVNGDDGADIVSNAGTITGVLTVSGGADGDTVVNSGTISGGMTVSGGADADIVVNLAGGTLGGTITINGDDGADTVSNAGTITGPLTINGGADADLVVNSGTIQSGLTVNGGADADVVVNSGTIQGAVVIGGGADGDLVVNQAGGTISGTVTVNGDDGADTISNSGTILGGLVVNGGADGDTVVNAGTISGGMTVNGGADADTVINRGLVGGTISVNGDLGDDQFLNVTNGIGQIVFDAGDGNDLFVNDGAQVGSINIHGGDGNDVVSNTGTSVGSITFDGGTGADALINSGGAYSGTTSTVAFLGGTGADVFINRGSGLLTNALGATGANAGSLSLSFTGDVGADILLNYGSSLNAITFDGGTEADGFLNAGNQVARITFLGGAGADVFRNDGTALGILNVSGGADADLVVNSSTGTISGTVTVNGDDGADAVSNSGTITGALVVSGGADGDLVVNQAGGTISGPIVISGGADGDTVVNMPGGTMSGTVTVNGDDGADTVVNAGTITGTTIINGGTDNDTVSNAGTISGTLTVNGDSGVDRLFNSAYIDGVLTPGTLGNVVFNGGADNDTVVNTAGGMIGGTITVNGDDGADTVSNAGTIAGLVTVNGGADADIVVNQPGGTILGGIVVNGGADGDLVVNAGAIGGTVTVSPGADLPLLTGALVVIGGSDGDVVVNLAGGTIGGTVSVNGDDGADIVQNSGVIQGAVIINGGADDDIVVNQAGGVITGTVTVNGDDGADNVTNSGLIGGTLTVNGGADADIVVNSGTISGGMIVNGGTDGDNIANQAGGTIGGTITINGDDGADVVVLSGTIAGPIAFNGDLGDDLLVLEADGNVGALTVVGGSGNDRFVIQGRAASLALSGGDGNDVYMFVGAPSGSLAIGESYTGTGDTSVDTLDFSAYTAGAVTLDLALTTVQAIAGGASPLSIRLTDGNGIENVIGTALADTIRGNDRANTLAGAAIPDDRSAATAGAVSRIQWVLLDFDSETQGDEHVYTPEERNAIQSRLEAFYWGPDAAHPWFHVQFVQDPHAPGLPAAGGYATLFFNKTPSFDRPGGEASEVDFRNTNLGGYASIQINGLVGGEAQPAATSDNFVKLASKIGAHELGHLMGIRHSDVFGPIGLGLHSPPGGVKFSPDYAGPSGAYETFDHLISSPATVGSDRFNDVRDLYFGPREAIKLAFGESGVTVAETQGQNRSIATAQPITLAPLTVPNTALSSLDSGKTFQVGAIAVTGALTIDPATGRAERDYYRFAGRKGDIITLSVESSFLASLAGQDTIDSVLRLLDDQGQPVSYDGGLAVNDDQFEATDSLLIDVVLPRDGVYTVEVSSFSRDPQSPTYDPSNPASPLNPANLASTINPLNPYFSQDRLDDFLAARDGTDVGGYNLFIYRFAATNTTDQGDVLDGRGGDDTIRGGQGTDAVIGGAGRDSLDGGDGPLSLPVSVPSGTVKVSNPTRTFSTNVSFTDAFGSAYWDATVDYGDGTTQAMPGLTNANGFAISHPYAASGIYTVVVTVTNDDGIAGQATINVTIDNNRLPTITPIADQSVNESTNLAIMVPGSDPDAPVQTLTYSLVSAPVGMAIDAATGALSWTPTEAQGPNTYTIIVQVADNSLNQGIAQATFHVTVNEVNVAPTLAGVPATATSTLLSTVAFTATATDPDIPAQTLTYGLLGAPAGAAINPTTGAFSWTPTEAQAGAAYGFNVTVFDGLTTSSMPITVTVASIRKDVSFVPGPIGGGTYGGSGTFTATLISEGSPLSGKLVTFTLYNGVVVTTVGTVATNASGVATLTGVSLAGFNAGTYTSYVGAAFAGDSSYKPGSRSGDLVVSKAALTITAGSRTKTFGTTATFAGTEFTASGLVASDSVTSVTLTSPGAVSSAVVGSYPITPSNAAGSGLSNYTIGYALGSLTVVTRAGSIYVLNPNVAGALTVSGNATLQLVGDLVVDSNSSAAITASGNAKVSAPTVLNLGGVRVTGNASVTTPQGTPGSTGDPLAGLAAPAASGAVLSVNLSGNSSQTINPGTYSSIKVSGNASLTLNPGVYVIAGGGLSVSGNGNISGNGVTIYNAGSNVTGGGTPTYAGIGLGGNGSIQLTAPTAGTYAGILIFQARDNTRAMALNGNSAVGIAGMIYAPKALLSISGNAQLTSHVPMIVDQLQLSGNGSSTLLTEGSQVTTGELLAGDRAIYIDDPSGYFDASALARIDDAVAMLDELLLPYSINISFTTDISTADIILNTNPTSALGGFDDGVLGCSTSDGRVTLIKGWDWYTGDDVALIGAGQYDFETIVSHELGHTLGLGHSENPFSTMYASLATQTGRRSITVDDLGIREAEGGPDGLRAVPPTARAGLLKGAGYSRSKADSVASVLDFLYPATSEPRSPETISSSKQLVMPLKWRENRVASRVVPTVGMARQARAVVTSPPGGTRSTANPTPLASASGRGALLVALTTEMGDPEAQSGPPEA